MLVISRKKDESIEIGGGIRILVCSISGSKVRLGIEAPRDVPIRRSELTLCHPPIGNDPDSNLHVCQNCG